MENKNFEERMMHLLDAKEDAYFKEKLAARRRLVTRLSALAVVVVAMVGLFLNGRNTVWSDDLIHTQIDTAPGYATLTHQVADAAAEKKLIRSYREHSYHQFDFDDLPEGYARTREGYGERFSWAEFENPAGATIKFDIMYVVGGKSNIPIKGSELKIKSTPEQVYYFLADEDYSFVTWVNRTGNFTLTALRGYEDAPPVSAEELLEMAASFRYLDTEVPKEGVEAK